MVGDLIVCSPRVYPSFTLLPVIAITIPYRLKAQDIRAGWVDKRST
jgi:hypothetical protein